MLGALTGLGVLVKAAADGTLGAAPDDFRRQLITWDHRPEVHTNAVVTGCQSVQRGAVLPSRPGSRRSAVPIRHPRPITQ